MWSLPSRTPIQLLLRGFLRYNSSQRYTWINVRKWNFVSSYRTVGFVTYPLCFKALYCRRLHVHWLLTSIHSLASKWVMGGSRMHIAIGIFARHACHHRKFRSIIVDSHFHGTVRFLVYTIFIEFAYLWFRWNIETKDQNKKGITRRYSQVQTFFIKHQVDVTLWICQCISLTYL